MLMLMRKWEQHKTSKWVRSPYVSAYAYAYVGGVLTCYAYVMLMRLWEPALKLECLIVSENIIHIPVIQKSVCLTPLPQSIH